MTKKIYIVKVNEAYDTFEGTWNDYDYIDSVWADEETAKMRVNLLANEYIEKLWYEDESVPGEDYKETWDEKKWSVIYEPDKYTQTHFYIEEQPLRDRWPEEEKDLPAYFTTT